MTATIVLVRHGTTASTGHRLGGRTDTPLDEAGQAQAAAAAERLADLPVRAVYASPLARTMQTAEPIARAHRLSVQRCDGVLEVEYGRWTDRPMRPLTRTKLWPVIQQRPSLVGFPDGETIRAAQLRAVDAVEEVAARHRKKVVVVVSHADVIKVVVAFYAGMPLDAFQRLAVGPASITVIQTGGGTRPAIVRLNDDGPLRREQFAVRRPAKPSARGRRPAKDST